MKAGADPGFLVGGGMDIFFKGMGSGILAILGVKFNHIHVICPHRWLHPLLKEEM